MTKTKKPLDAKIVRILEFAFKLRDGDVDSVQAWLTSLGCKDVYRNEKELHLTGLTGVRVGMIGNQDPITCAVQIGFALAGPFWPHVYPELLSATSKQWKSERDQRKAAEASA